MQTVVDQQLRLPVLISHVSISKLIAPAVQGQTLLADLGLTTLPVPDMQSSDEGENVSAPSALPKAAKASRSRSSWGLRRSKKAYAEGSAGADAVATEAGAKSHPEGSSRCECMARGSADTHIRCPSPVPVHLHADRTRNVRGIEICMLWCRRKGNGMRNMLRALKPPSGPSPFEGCAVIDEPASLTGSLPGALLLPALF